MPEEKQSRQMDLGELVSELVSLEIDFNNKKLGMTTDNFTGDMEEYTKGYEQRKSELIQQLKRREDYYLPRRAV